MAYPRGDPHVVCGSRRKCWRSYRYVSVSPQNKASQIYHRHSCDFGITDRPCRLHRTADIVIGALLSSAPVRLQLGNQDHNKTQQQTCDHQSGKHQYARRSNKGFQTLGVGLIVCTICPDLSAFAPKNDQRSYKTPPDTDRKRKLSNPRLE